MHFDQDIAARPSDLGSAATNLKPFLLSRRDGSSEVILADSWTQRDTDGVIRFFDANSRLIHAMAISELRSIVLLTAGDLIWENGQTVYTDRRPYDAGQVVEGGPS